MSRVACFAALLALGCGHEPSPPPAPAVRPVAAPTPTPAPPDATPPDATPDATPPAAAAVDAAVAAAVDADDSSLLDREHLGPLTFGLADAKLIELLGKPTRRTAPQREEATGSWATRWTWPAGVAADLVGDSARGPWRARVLSVTAPSTLATVAGIHVGSTRAALAAAYPRSADDDGGDPTTYLVGSTYGGVAFHLAGDRVTSIDLGVLAF